MVAGEPKQEPSHYVESASLTSYMIIMSIVKVLVIFMDNPFFSFANFADWNAIVLYKAVSVNCNIFD